MNQTTVGSKVDSKKKHSSINVIISYATGRAFKVPPEAYGSFSTTYEGMEIPAENGEFDEKTGEIIEADGTTHTVSKEEMRRYKENKPVRNRIAEIKKSLGKISEKSSKTKKSTSKVAEGRGE